MELPEEQQGGDGGYRSFVMSKWADIYNLSEQARVEILNANYDHDVVHEFIAKLTRLWIELQPKVKGNSEVPKDLQATYQRFRKYAFAPSAFFEEQDDENKLKMGIEDLFEMEECLRDVLEKLDIMVFE